MDRKEHVLVVPEAQVADSFRRPAFLASRETLSRVDEIIRRHGRLEPRDWAESTSAVKQIVAVCIVRHGNKLLCIRRSKNANRAHMRLKHTLVVGGHVDERDVKSSRDPVGFCAKRELLEELGVVPAGLTPLIGCIADPETTSGNLHLAVVFDAEIEDDNVRLHPGMDNKEFVNASESAVWKLRSLTELRSLAASNSFDRWSSLFLGSHAAQTLLDAREPVLSSQRQIDFA